MNYSIGDTVKYDLKPSMRGIVLVERQYSRNYSGKYTIYYETTFSKPSEGMKKYRYDCLISCRLLLIEKQIL